MRGRHSLRHRGVLALAVIGVTCASIWVFMNRTTLAAACLRTIDGVTSKIAHLNEPFGMGASVTSPNPVLGVVPDFSLTERSGRTVTRSDLLGAYWVASFIFTRCATSCPMTVLELDRLQKELPAQVRLVSITVDPEFDTPAVLSDYAERVGAGVERWLFLTGDKQSIQRCIREGFRLAVEENEGAEPGWQVTHSPRLALVDPKGRIRGYYESANADDQARLRDDIRRLLGRDAPSDPLVHG